MTIFFTSDTHFGHGNIIKYCNRPFSSSEHQTNELIKNWNSRVSPKDTVYFLGDFFFPMIKSQVIKEDVKNFLEICYALNGKIHFICGNHDAYFERYLNDPSYTSEIRERFSSICLSGQKEVKVGLAYPIVLNHYPMLVWNRAHLGAIHLYGHVHSTKNGLISTPERGVFKFQNAKNSHDVGVDAWDYYPVSLEELLVTLRK